MENEEQAGHCDQMLTAVWPEDRACSAVLLSLPAGAVYPASVAQGQEGLLGLCAPLLTFGSLLCQEGGVEMRSQLGSICQVLVPVLLYKVSLWDVTAWPQCPGPKPCPMGCRAVAHPQLDAGYGWGPALPTHRGGSTVC